MTAPGHAKQYPSSTPVKMPIEKVDKVTVILLLGETLLDETTYSNTENWL